ncbi:MAG: hypothetical protein WC584_03680 [Candidatus Pacearchaeota archaeon]
MKIIYLIISFIILVGVVSASNQERITVSVFVKAKIPEANTNKINQDINRIFYNQNRLFYNNFPISLLNIKLKIL